MPTMSLLGHSLLYTLLYFLICNSSIFAENAPANANGIRQLQNSNCKQNMNTGSRPQLMNTLLNIAQSKGILSDIQPALEPLLTNPANMQDLAQMTANLSKDRQKVSNRQGQSSRTLINPSSLQPSQTDVCNQNTKVPPSLNSGSLQLNSLPPTGFCEQKSRQLQEDTSNQNSVLSYKTVNLPSLNVLQQVNLPSPMISSSNVVSQNYFKTCPKQDVPYTFPQKSSYQPITLRESLPIQSSVVQEVKLTPQNIQINKIDPVVQCQNIARKENYVIQQQSPNSDSTQNINNGPGSQLMSTLLNIAKSKGILPDILSALGPLLNTQNNLQDIAQIVANLPKDKQKNISGLFPPREISIATSLSQPVQTEFCNRLTNVPIVCESLLPTKSSVVQEVNLMPQNIQANNICQYPAVSCYNVAPNPNDIIQQQLPNSDTVQNINNGPGSQLMNTLLNIAQAKGILPDILPALTPLFNSQNNLQDIAQLVAKLPQDKHKIETVQSKPRDISTVSPPIQLVQKEVCIPNTVVCESTPTTQTRQMQEVNLLQQNILPNKIAPVLPCTNIVAPRPNTEIIPQNTVISDESLQVPLNLHITLPPPNIPAPRIAILSPSPSCGCDPSIKCACSPSSSCDCFSPCSQTGSCQTALCNEGQPPPETVPCSLAPVINPILPIIVDGGRGNRDNSFEYLLPILFLSLLRNGGYGGFSGYGGNGYGAGGNGFCNSNNCGYGNSYGCNCPFNCGCSNFPLPLPYPVPTPYYLLPVDSGETNESSESNESSEYGSGQEMKE